MFSRLLLTLPLSLALFAETATAGQVLRVGPGQTYATIQAAIDAANNGDIIVVDPGVYAAFALAGKRLSIVPSGGNYTVQTAPGVPAIDVSGIGVGMTVSIHGAVINYAEPTVPAVRVRGNAGAVRFAQLFVIEAADLNFAPTTSAVYVEDTEEFWIWDSEVVPPAGTRHFGNTTNPLGANDGISGLELHNSNCVAQNVILQGYDNEHDYGGDGLRARDDSTVWLRYEGFRAPRDSRFIGGNAGSFGGHAVHLLQGPPAQQSRITMCRTVSLVFGQGGIRDGGYYGINNNPGLSVSGGFQSWRLPTVCSGNQVCETQVDANVVSIGTSFPVRIFTVASLPYALVWSLDTVYTRSISGYYGRSLIDLNNFTVLTTGTSPGGAFIATTVAIPNSNALRGLELTFQTSLTSGQNALSGPAMVVVGP